MRYRSLSGTGDYTMGRAQQFLADSPECVAQAVKTRLALHSGEWFLDADEGTPYATEILGAGTAGTRDLSVKARILSTPGVLEILSYSSTVTGRSFSVTAVISTVYGTTSIRYS